MARVFTARPKCSPLRLVLFWPPLHLLFVWGCLNICLGGHVALHPVAMYLSAKADYMQYCRHDLDRAERLYHKALADYKGEQIKDALCAKINLNLGHDLAMGSRPREAEAFYQIAIAIRQRLFGTGNIFVAEAQRYLGRLYRAEGRQDEAFATFVYAESQDALALGVHSVPVGDDLIHEGLMWNDQGRYSNAQSRFESALRIFQEKLGDKHPRTAEAKLLIGIMLAKQGKLEAAEPFCKEGLDRMHSPDRRHKRIGWAYTLNLAILSSKLGNYDQANALFARAYRKATRHGNEENLDALHTKQRWAESYLAQNRLSEAESMASQVLEGRTKLIGEANGETAQTHYLLGQIYEKTKRMKAAYLLYQKAYNDLIDGQNANFCWSSEDYMAGIRRTAAPAGFVDPYPALYESSVIPGSIESPQISAALQLDTDCRAGARQTPPRPAPLFDATKPWPIESYRPF